MQEVDAVDAVVEGGRSIVAGLACKRDGDCERRTENRSGLQCCGLFLLLRVWDGNRSRVTGRIPRRRGFRGDL